ncbi:MAG TPA: RluA family pseudouridine synthase [Thermoanaerobaculia bacterium]|nr:RluA family pseudouridine synthase [Thermoanaerobaculia bacterium]
MQAKRHELVVEPLFEGVRLDKALARLLPDYSRSLLAKLIEDAMVTVDSRVVTKPSHLLRSGQRIEIVVPPPTPSGVVPEEIAIDVLFDDSDLAVIDKPAGLVVHPAAGHRDATLVNALLHRFPSLSGIGGVQRPGIVHRLDKDTSGVMVIARNDFAHRKLTAAWGSPLVVKEYLALVYGTPRSEEGTIERPIGRNPRDRKKMGVVAGGRQAMTMWRVAERFRHVSLIRCRLLTGRTHQIRVHLAALGHPIVGDRLYSGPQWRGIPDKRIQKALAGFPRQALHAVRLSFPHPRTGEILTFEAPLPANFRTLLKLLRGEPAGG